MQTRITVSHRPSCTLKPEELELRGRKRICKFKKIHPPIHGCVSKDANDRDFCPKLEKMLSQGKPIINEGKCRKQEREKYEGFLCPKLDLSLSGDGRSFKSHVIDKDPHKAILHPHAKNGGRDGSILLFNYSLHMPELLAF